MKPWKRSEQKLARLFGSTRTPLSGGNSKMTRSDTLHPSVFIEVKHGKRWAGLLKLYNETAELARKEHKIPVVAIHPFGSVRYLLMVDQKYLRRLAEELDDGRAEPDAGVDGE